MKANPNLFRTLLLLPVVVLVAVAVALFGVGIRSAETQTTAPKIQDLGTLGGSSSYTKGINASGKVVGVSDTSDGEKHGFLYDGSATQSDGSATQKMQDLGDLGGSGSYANGINDFGKVVGSSYTSDGEQHGFLYDESATQKMQDLNDLIPADSGWTISSASAINSDGKIAASGYGNNPPDPSVCPYQDSGPAYGAAFVLTPATTDTPATYEVQDLGTLGGYYSRATGINDSGQVVGDSNSDPCAWRGQAFLYDSATKQMQSLGMIEARGINASGQVVGYSQNWDLYENCTNLDCERAFLYDESATLKIRDLGTLGGTPYGTFGSEARGINDSGKVVGLSGIGDCLHHWVSGSGPTYAFLYDSTNGMKDLNTLLPADTGWTIDEATAINSDGKIAANGHKDGVGRHALLLTQPSDSPADSQAPCPPAIDSPANGTITRDSTPEFSGTNTSDSTKVTIYDGQAELGEATIGSPGTRWSFTPTTALSEGPHSITAKAEDAAGNTSGASETWWVTVDNTAPTVSSVYPASGARNVALNTSVTGTFSEKMDPTSITTSTFNLHQCPSTTSTNCTTQVTNVAVSPSNDGLSATLDPSTLLASRTRYKGVVTTGAKDVAGNALNQQKNWYFTTGSK